MWSEALGLQEVLIAPRCPWQSPYVERLIGSVRRECLDHVIVLNQARLHHVLESYFAYYHGWRTHLGLGRTTRPGGCKDPRRVKSSSFPKLGDCIIATSDRPPEMVPAPTPGQRRWASGADRAQRQRQSPS